MPINVIGKDTKKKKAWKHQHNNDVIEVNGQILLNNKGCAQLILLYYEIDYKK